MPKCGAEAPAGPLQPPPQVGKVNVGVRSSEICTSVSVIGLSLSAGMVSVIAPRRTKRLAEGTCRACPAEAAGTFPYTGLCPEALARRHQGCGFGDDVLDSYEPPTLA